MSEVFINKVAESGIITINLENYLPKEEIVVFDIKDYLFMGLILKEKEFRQSLKELDLSVYKNKIVAITCSADAIIPMWAYMLITTTLSQESQIILMGSATEVKNKLLIRAIHHLNTEEFKDKRVVIKGCGETLFLKKLIWRLPIFFCLLQKASCMESRVVQYLYIKTKGN